MGTSGDILWAALRWIVVLLVVGGVVAIGLVMVASGLTAAWLILVVLVTGIVFAVRWVWAFLRRRKFKAHLKTLVASLRRSDVLVPLNAAEDAAARPVPLRGARDKDGNLWVRLYTDQAELVRALAPGSAYGAMSFGEAFKMISASGVVRGILINSASDSPYLISSEDFPEVERMLD
jgi:hypothetical protein